MCQLTVNVELNELKFAVQSLAQLAGTPGSFERENALNAAQGICGRLNWCRDMVVARENLGAVPAPAPGGKWVKNEWGSWVPERDPKEAASPEANS